MQLTVIEHVELFHSLWQLIFAWSYRITRLHGPCELIFKSVFSNRVMYSLIQPLRSCHLLLKVNAKFQELFAYMQSQWCQLATMKELPGSSVYVYACCIKQRFKRTVSLLSVSYVVVAVGSTSSFPTARLMQLLRILWLLRLI